MKIWTTKDGADVVLCDHGRRGPSNFVPQVQRRKDILPFVQSSFAKVKARGNVYRIWSFSSSIEHESVAAAQLYLITLHQSTPEQADAWVELEDQATRYLIQDCFFEFAPASPVGVFTTVAWTLTFGGIRDTTIPTNLADVFGIELTDALGVDLTLDDAQTGDPE